MVTALISDENRKSFSGMVMERELAEADIVIGAFDPVTMSAVGVLTAEIIDDEKLAITWIFVMEEYRRKGAGRDLLLALSDNIRKLSAPEFIVCSHIEPDIGDCVYELLEGCGFIEERKMNAVLMEARIGHITVHDMPAVCRVVSLGELGGRQWEELCRQRRRAMESSEVWHIMPSENYKYYNPDCSVVALGSGGEPLGDLLLSADRTAFAVRSFFTVGEPREQILYSMISGSVKKIKERFSPGTHIRVCSSNPRFEKLMMHITGNRAVKRGYVFMQMADLEMMEDAVRDHYDDLMDTDHSI